MKKILSILLILFIFTSIASADLIGYWPFDGDAVTEDTAIDTSGNGNDGAISGATVIPGKIGQGLSFDGINDYINVGNIDITGSITLSAWVKQSVYWDDNTIIAKWIGFPGDRQYLLTIEDNGYVKFVIRTSDGVIETHLATITATKLNTWYHVVGIFDGSAKTMDIYLNGKKDATTYSTGDSSIMSIDTNAIIGAYNEGDNENFEGIIDEVRIYNEALSPTEVLELYQLGRNIIFEVDKTLDDGLVMWQSFDGDSITEDTALDRTANDNDGAITGAVAIAGKIGQALNFDIGIKTVNCGHDVSLDIESEGTLAAWVKIDTVKSQTIIVRSSDASWESGRITLNIRSTGSVQVSLADGIDVDQPATATGLISVGQWYHLAFTFNGSDIYIYIDGVEKKTAPQTVTPEMTGYDLVIGYWNGIGRFSGIIDEVRIYDEALTQAQITELYQKGRNIKIDPNFGGNILIGEE